MEFDHYTMNSSFTALPLLQGFRVNQSAVTMSTGELACTYASLLLHDDGIAITSEKIATLVKAAGVSVESYWPSLFAKLAEKRSIDDLILNAGSGGAAAPVAVSAPAGGAVGAVAAAAPAVEEKKEEVQEESDDGDLGFSLFD
nr:60s acidic ribosomal protein p1-2 [Quercus suber]